MSVYCFLDDLVKAREMSYQEVARKTGITYPGLWKIAKGKTNPSLQIIAKLCKVLDCDVGDLFSIKKKR